jgi:hemolysin activation/secretion protein
MAVPGVRSNRRGSRAVGRGTRAAGLALAGLLASSTVCSGAEPEPASAAVREASPLGSPGEAAPLRIAPARFEIEGCTAFDAATLERTLAPFTARPLATTDLLDLVEALRRLYADAGHGTTEILLPDQDLEDGRIRIEVHEGRLESIEIEGTLAYQPYFFRSRIARAAAVPLDVPKLYRTLEQLQADPGVERIAAVLERVGPGRHRLRVAVQERSPWSLQARYSNHRAPSVGSDGGRFAFEHPTLLGLGDRLLLEGQVSEGLRDFGLRWDAPLGPLDTRFFVAWRRGRADIVERDVEALEIEGRYESISLGLRHPLLWTPTWEAWLDVYGDWRNGASSIFGRIECFQSDLRDCTPTVTALRASQELVHRTREHVAVLRSTLSFGLDLLGATPETDGGDRDGEFVSWLLQGQWVERLPDLDPVPLFDGTQLALRGELQLANDPLVAVEQIAVGGGTTVRGYRENQLVRDNGVIASAELRWPVVRSSFGRPVVMLAPFFDFGQAWDRKQNRKEEDPIASTGLALAVSPIEALTAEISWGHRWRDVEPKGRGLQREGIFVEVVWDVF